MLPPILPTQRAPDRLCTNCSFTLPCGWLFLGAPVHPHYIVTALIVKDCRRTTPHSITMVGARGYILLPGGGVVLTRLSSVDL
jgi:hypothetical protein